MSEAPVPKRSKRQWEAQAKVRISRYEAGSSVEADFVKQGLDRETARAIVDEAVRSARSRATTLLVGSTLFAGLGLLVTIASYSEAASSPSGGVYWIWYGPVIAGGIAALIALGRLSGIRR